MVEATEESGGLGCASFLLFMTSLGVGLGLAPWALLLLEADPLIWPWLPALEILLLAAVFAVVTVALAAGAFRATGRYVGFTAKSAFALFAVVLILVRALGVGSFLGMDHPLGMAPGTAVWYSGMSIVLFGAYAFLYESRLGRVYVCSKCNAPFRMWFQDPLMCPGTEDAECENDAPWLCEPCADAFGLCNTCYGAYACPVKGCDFDMRNGTVCPGPAPGILCPNERLLCEVHNPSGRCDLCNRIKELLEKGFRKTRAGQVSDLTDEPGQPDDPLVRCPSCGLVAMVSELRVEGAFCCIEGCSLKRVQVPPGGPDFIVD